MLLLILTITILLATSISSPTTNILYTITIFYMTQTPAERHLQTDFNETCQGIPYYGKLLFKPEAYWELRQTQTTPFPKNSLQLKPFN